MKMILFRYLSLTVFTIYCAEDFESIERPRIQNEAGMMYSFGAKPDSLAIERLDGRTVAIVVSSLGKDSRHVYVNAADGPYDDKYYENPGQCTQYNQLARWWTDFNQGKNKTVLHLILLGCTKSTREIQYDKKHWEKWATSLNKILQSKQVHVMTYEDTTPVISEVVDSHPDDCVVTCLNQTLAVSAIKDSHSGTITRKSLWFSLQ